MMPAYRDGTIIIVSPAAPLRRGDRIVVKTRTGEVMANELKRKTAKTLEVKSLNPNIPSARSPSRTCCGSPASYGQANSGLCRNLDLLARPDGPPMRPLLVRPLGAFA